MNEDKKVLYNRIPILEEEIKNIPPQINFPNQYFSLFFHEIFLSKILANSNIYLNYKNNKIQNKNIEKVKEVFNETNNNGRVGKIAKLTYEYLEKYIACLALMGIAKLASYNYGSMQIMSFPKMSSF